MPTTHGATRGRKITREYKSWCNAKSRCYRKNHDKYQYYGGRGITMCEAWRNSFATFLKDMGPKPTRAYSLERIDNDGPYSPENCRWATHSEQMHNRRPFENRNVRLVLDGLRMGRLRVIRFAEMRSYGRRGQQTFWTCVCDCGREVVVNGSSLKEGKTKSCGCLKREKAAVRMRERAKTLYYPRGADGCYLKRKHLTTSS